ncbi:MAG: magnesium chelatase [Thermoanaerobaculaceae bacterium]|jgi:magnesium chelatase subunit I
MTAGRAATLGALKAAGYRSRPVKQEVRENLMVRLRDGASLFDGVVGYERTVVPGIVNALLAHHDLILLGLRGQAKTRILRALVTLLDDEIPVVAGSELNDDPFHPTSAAAQRLVEEAGDDTPIEWLPREARYNEKLATPDATIADLIGDVDPIKAATRRLTYADPEVIHFGIVPRTNRGIFAINELPDLAPRIQVGLLNILEERDIQIRGFPVRIPLDILMVFSANPEDYTNRGTIITPLKDRISSQILTHYPKDAATAVTITRQEAWRERAGPRVVVPEAVDLLIEEIAFAARESDLVDQSSGVSARVPIAAMELLVSNLERRSLATGEVPVYPRLVDVHTLLPAITGKVEMVYEGEQKGPEVVARTLIGVAVKKRFLASFPAIGREVGTPEDSGPYAPIVAWFAGGGTVTLSDEQVFPEYEAELKRVPGLARLVEGIGETPQERAFAAEMVLEGLHQYLKLAREDLDSTVSYREMVKFQLMRRAGRGESHSDAN